MAKQKSVFICQSCGNRTPKWVGRCGACGEWGTVAEEIAQAAPAAGTRAAFGAIESAAPMRLREVQGADVARAPVGIEELDRVLGGGLVPGSLVLIGGDPGIGKSTLLLQASDYLARAGRRVLYVTGEESPQQTRLRFDRVGSNADDLWLVAETSVERIDHHAQQLGPEILVVDSVQTLYTEDVSSAPGSVTQLREVTARLMRLAKGRGISTFLVGHVTKDGAIAGPRVLEHMVDTVLYLEGEPGNAIRLLRAVKNRFGSTNELAAFEMRERGLSEVSNPSALFLAERAVESAGSVVVASFKGTRPFLVEVQALVSTSSYGTPRRTAIGADTGRVALLLAVLERQAGLSLGGADVFVNVAGGLKLAEPAADLALLAALASSHLNRVVDAHTVVFGEVGLGGEVRAVVGADARAREAQKLGFRRVVAPVSSAEQIAAVDGIEVLPVKSVEQMIDRLF